jgi:alpha-beta hydrolase superfamily lysophospholipase
MSQLIPRTRPRIGMAALVLTSVCLLAACGGGDVAQALKPGHLILSQDRSTSPRLPVGTRTRFVHYSMESVDASLTYASALMFTPPGPAPAGGWPLAVWAHGTTGVADSCAPSRAPGYADIDAVAALLEQGMAVLAPDYEGLGTPGAHPYFIRKSHALGVLRAVQAVMADKDQRLASRWAVIGHSQGGNVALAAAEEAAVVAGIGSPKAVVLLAPGWDLAKTAADLFGQIDVLEAQGQVEQAALITLFLNFNGALVLQGAKAAQPSIDVRRYFGARMQPLVDLALNERTCGDFFTAVLSDLNAWVGAGNTVASYPGLRRDFASDPVIAGLLASNDVGKVRVNAPIRVVQGTADEQVPAVATRRLVSRLQSIGVAVDLIEIPDGDHGSAVEPAVLGNSAAYLGARLRSP